jgi:transposase
VIAARASFSRRMLRWAVRRLVFIDESGINLSQTRAEGRALRGERVVDYVPGSRWETYSVIAGLRSTGVIAPMMIPGAMNTASLLTWVEVVLAPKLQRGDIVVWDNLRIHSDPEVVHAIKARGARLEFTPPYSPEFNPIEEAWSKMKAILRAAKARTVGDLVEFLGDALRAISPADCRGWFRHAGYVVP